MSDAEDSQPQVWLASTSPRRRELLAQVGLRFATLSPDVDESRLGDEDPGAYVMRLAEAKAGAGLAALASDDAAPVIGADTAVVIDGEILGKPDDRDGALEQLMALSGRAHEVFSAVAIANPPASSVCVVSTVWFKGLSEAECLAYIDTGEPMDKAGGYGIQGAAAAFVSRLEGSYSAVMGLPLFETCEMLRARGVTLFA